MSEPAIYALAFGRTFACQPVYSGDVYEPPPGIDWTHYDDGRGDFLVGLDWFGGPVGFGVPTG